MGNVLCKICRRTENDSTNLEPLIGYQNSGSDNSDDDDSDNSDDSDSDNNDGDYSDNSDDSYSDDIFQSGSEESRSDTSVASRKTYQFTCYDEIDPTWLRIAAKEADRIYVHGEILDWIVPKINEILNENLRATVEEVYHHNLDGPVYLIKFYKSKYQSQSKIEPNKFLQKIKDKLKYKMPWKTNPTFFLPLDLTFAIRKKRILSKVRDLNLLDGYSATLLSVNWSGMREIEIFEFSIDLSLKSKMQIETILRKKIRYFFKQTSLYICDQFEWHQISQDYIEVDKVAMDVCIEEWKRHDLLKDFSIEDILNLDLANKDYRDPYYNEYLDRYIDKLLTKALLQLSIDDDGKHIINVAEFQSYIANYFALRVDETINMFSSNLSNKTVNLIDNEPSPDTLNHRDYKIEYNISNYEHFNDSLLRRLLNNSNNYQIYKIRFDREFNFTYPTNDTEMVQHLTNDQRYKSSIKREIIIELLDCIEINVQKLVDFVMYLFKLFSEKEKINLKILMWFTNCMLDDYSFFEHIKNNIDELQFTSMKISTRQMKILSSALTQQKQVTLVNCKHLTDNDLMILLEHIDIENLKIDGSRSCTPAIYYLIAEYLMNKEGVDTIMAYRVGDNLIEWPYKFKTIGLELFNNGDQIVFRNHRTKELVDLYCLLNDIEEDLDPSNRMYME